MRLAPKLSAALPRPARALATTVALLVCFAAPPAAAQDRGAAGPPGPDLPATDVVGAADTGEESLLLDPILAPLLEDALFARAKVGLQVVDVTTGEEVFAHQADEAMVPASVTKALTSAVALRTLGPGHTFATDLRSEGELDPDGLLAGDLYVVGGGDPTLVVEHVWKMVRDLSSAGVAEIDGDLVFDDGFFDDNGFVPGWNKAVDIANGPAYFAPLGALSVNFNTTCLLVAPGSERAAGARVDVETPADNIVVENEVVTGSSRSRAWLKVEREVGEDGGTVTFTLSGSVPLGSDTTRLYRAVGDPTDHFMAVFRSLLEDRGIRWTGGVRRGTVPDEARVLVRHSSAPLGTLLARMNKRSSNIMAEHVLRTVGAKASGGIGSTAAGVEAMKAYLDELGVPRDEYVLVNGSGLSRDIRMRPSHITAVLVDLWHDRRVGPEFQASMAIAGVDGTLRRRLGEDEAGLVRGKTGSLNSVYCLAGYLHGGDGRAYAFAFLVNDFSGSSRPVRTLQDRFAEALLQWDGTMPPVAADAEDGR